jgi:hypothetical protein
MTLFDRVMRKVRVTDDGCWEWIGGGGRRSPAVYMDNKVVSVVRAMDRLYGLRLSRTNQVPRSCGNRWCVYPDHLEEPSKPIRTFLTRVSRQADGCWRFTGPIGSHGYGVFGAGGRLWRAHCFAYESLVGPVPQGLQLDHLCRNKWCVSPAHLEPVSGSENMLRRPESRKRFCRHGHAMTHYRRQFRRGRPVYTCWFCRPVGTKVSRIERFGHEGAAA